MSATDVTTPKAPPWSPDDLFQPNHPGSCCTCYRMSAGQPSDYRPQI